MSLPLVVGVVGGGGGGDASPVNFGGKKGLNYVRGGGLCTSANCVMNVIINQNKI
jgi:hypothetical protein